MTSLVGNNWQCGFYSVNQQTEWTCFLC